MWLLVGFVIFHHFVDDGVNVRFLLAGGFCTTFFQFLDQFVDFLFGEFAGYLLTQFFTNAKISDAFIMRSF